MPFDSSQPFGNGEVVKIMRPKTRELLNQGMIVAAGPDFILVGAHKYKWQGREVWTNRDLGACRVERIAKAPAGPWAA